MRPSRSRLARGDSASASARDSHESCSTSSTTKINSLDVLRGLLVRSAAPRAQRRRTRCGVGVAWARACVWSGTSTIQGRETTDGCAQYLCACGVVGVQVDYRGGGAGACSSEQSEVGLVTITARTAVE